MRKKPKGPAPPAVVPTGFATLRRGSGAAPAPAAPAEDRGPAAVARQVRQHYIAQRSAFESLKAGTPVRYVVPRRYDGAPPVTVDGELVLDRGAEPVWPKLARFLVDRKIDPTEYLQAQFAARDPHLRAPEPNALMSPACVARWERAHAGAGECIRIALASQLGTYRTEVSWRLGGGRTPPRLAAAGVLLDVGLALSPLFRYCLARTLGGPYFARIAARFEVDACLQYQRHHRHYAHYWKAIVPRGFARRSRQVYADVFGDDDDEETEEEEGRRARRRPAPPA